MSRFRHAFSSAPPLRESRNLGALWTRAKRHWIRRAMSFVDNWRGAALSKNGAESRSSRPEPKGGINGAATWRQGVNERRVTGGVLVLLGAVAVIEARRLAALREERVGGAAGGGDTFPRIIGASVFPPGRAALFIPPHAGRDCA